MRCGCITGSGRSNTLSDRSNGYEAVADSYIARRTAVHVGASTVRAWASELPRAGSVLDLGCGHGIPVATTLLDAGLTVYAVDASPSMIAAFRLRFPGVRAECSAVQDSSFFDRTFDGVIAWGLVFLLSVDEQYELIRKVSRALKPGGSFLFTSPSQVHEWQDILTGGRSVSLGAREYRRALEGEGLLVSGEAEDEGGNHYYFAARP